MCAAVGVVRWLLIAVVVRRLALSVVRWLLSAVRCLRFAVRCLLPAAFVVLCVMCSSSLYVVCWRLFVGV